MLITNFYIVLTIPNDYLYCSNCQILMTYFIVTLLMLGSLFFHYQHYKRPTTLSAITSRRSSERCSISRWCKCCESSYKDKYDSNEDNNDSYKDYYGSNQVNNNSYKDYYDSKCYDSSCKDNYDSNEDNNNTENDGKEDLDISPPVIWPICASEGRPSYVKDDDANKILITIIGLDHNYVKYQDEQQENTYKGNIRKCGITRACDVHTVRQIVIK